MEFRFLLVALLVANLAVFVCAAAATTLPVSRAPPTTARPSTRHPSSAPTPALTANPSPYHQQLIVPGYFYPGPQWTTLATAYNSSTAWFIANPNSGPGASFDATYFSYINTLRAAGIKVCGYVRTNYGNRNASDVKADVDKYRQWYRLDGFFLDESASLASSVPYYGAIAQYIRSNKTSPAILLNPGTGCDEAYTTVADIICLAASAWSSASLSWLPPSWAVRRRAAGRRPPRSCPQGPAARSSSRGHSDAAQQREVRVSD